MKYHLVPGGTLWENGVFCVPVTVVKKHLKFAGEWQLKVLLLALSENGVADAEELASRLGKPLSAVEDCLEYWVEEGVLVREGSEPEPSAAVEPPAAEEPPKRVLENLPMPNLAPKDIVRLCGEMPELMNLLQGAERVLASSLSASMKSNLVNMVTYYGLPVPVVLTLLEYYKSQRDKGKNMTTRTFQTMAKAWAEDGVTTLDDASRKLEELEGAEELWHDVITQCSFEFRKPTAAQQKMVARWHSEFSREMVLFACNTMMKYNEEEKRSLKLIDNILKEWKRKGFTTPDEVKAAPKDDGKKRKSSDGKLRRKPSFDIEELKRKAALDDDYDI